MFTKFGVSMLVLCVALVFGGPVELKDPAELGEPVDIERSEELEGPIEPIASAQLGESSELQKPAKLEKSSEEATPVVSRNYNYYCGRRLAYALAVVCNWEEHPLNDLQDINNNENLKQKAHHAIRRVTRSLVDECCLAPCDISDIMSYC